MTKSAECGMRNAEFANSVFRTLCFLFLLALPCPADTFLLPTANHAIYEPDQEDKFFVPTPGKTWTSGTFGCVRTEGWQLHEGLDIRCLQHDKKGEPIDPVMATADGTVAYINKRPSLSNYGNYIILRHQIDGLEIYSLYAHLREVRDGLKSGDAVKAGEQIAVMGRTSNTRQQITRDRAHVHFELDFMINDRYAAWHRATLPGERNDHGDWNGKNLGGIDPRALLLEQHQQGAKFNLREFMRRQTELCRVFVRATKFPWLQRYPALLRPNPLADKEGAAGYELALTFNGVVFQFTPRAASEFEVLQKSAKAAKNLAQKSDKNNSRFLLLSVNEAEQKQNPCRRFITNKTGRWELTPHATELLQLLTY